MPKIKKMGKGKKIGLAICAIFLAIICVALFVFFVLLRKDAIPTFSFSGYVYADGEALEGAKVSCGVMQAETDENGQYRFEGLSSVVEVTVSKENYLFSKDLVFVNGNRDNINFSGFELFSFDGVVRNGDEVVPFAEIQVVSSAGVFSTRANAFGQFNLPRLAGEVELSAFHEDINLFSQRFDKSKSDSLVVTGTTNVSGRIDTDSSDDWDFVLKLNGEEITLDSNLEFEVSEVSPNSKLTLSSENYHIDESEILVRIENGEFVFVAKKFFDISGSVVSGSTPLENVRVVAGKIKTYTNNLGEFLIEGVYGSCKAQAFLHGFEFKDQTVTCQDSNAEFVGTFNLSGKVFTDDSSLGGVRVECGSKWTNTNVRGEFVLQHIQLGDVVSVQSENYYVSNNNITIDSTDGIAFDLKRLYDISISIVYSNSPLNNVTATIGDNDYVSCDGVVAVAGLYGSVEVAFVCDGYKFDDGYVVDYVNSNIVVSPQKYYTLSGVVSSGTQLISGADVVFDGGSTTTNEEGYFGFANVYGTGKVAISANGFNPKTLDYSIDNSSLSVALNYDIVGEILCGGAVVENVKVSIGENSILSQDGTFAFSGLEGSNTISFEKEFYTFSDVIVQCGDNVSIECDYMIEGVVSNKQGGISGRSVILTSVSDKTQRTTQTDALGSFSFSGLQGEYLLHYEDDGSLALQPNSYEVDCGGIYNFSDSGYKFKGRVTTGGVPVAGVVVRAGNISTITNSSGYYKFDLLTQDEVLVLSKEGYEFENNNLSVNAQDFDKREDVDFECSYSISGVVSSGGLGLAMVEVNAGDLLTHTNDNGHYSISGLVGAVDFSMSLGNYYFDNPQQVSSSGIYNVSALFQSRVFVKTGDIVIDGVKVLFGTEEYETDSQGGVLIEDLEIGDKLLFEKMGYTIADYTFETCCVNVDISATYGVSGRVYLTSNMLSGVQVKCGDSIVVTDDRGYFELSNLSGFESLILEKDNLYFDNITLNGYSQLVVKAKYTVSGRITSAGIGIANADVVAGDLITITNQDGYYTLVNIEDEETIVVSKTGYNFVGEFNVNAPAVVNISGSYSISGTVSGGGGFVKGALVKFSDGSTTYTLDAGIFCCEGFETPVTIEVVTKGIIDNNYNDFLLDEMISGYREDISIDLKYNVTIELNNITSVPGVTISIGEETGSHNLIGLINFENMSGSQHIVISKSGYNFSPSDFVVNCNSTVVVAVKKEYSVTGKITTTSGLPASGVTILAGGKSAITDASGYYVVSGLVDDQVLVKVQMSVVDTAYSGENFAYSDNITQVNSSQSSNIDKAIPDEQYAYFLFKQGYQKLNDARSYQVFGSGSVNVDTIVKSSQEVSIVYKKDTKGNRIIQNLNHGKTIVGVDPCVAQLTFVDTQNKAVKFKTIKGEDNVQANTANWDKDSWHSTTYADYLKDYGVNAEGYYPYIINQSTITSIDNFSLNDDVYTFTLKLAVTEAMYYYYTIQMSKMCSSQTFDSFVYCSITYKIGQDGFIRIIDIDEQYKVKAGVVATVTDKFTYTFKTTSGDDIISDIRIDSSDNIKASLLEEVPTKASETLNSNRDNIPKYDVYCEKRRVLV